MKKYMPVNKSYHTFFILDSSSTENTVFSYSLSKTSCVKIVIYEVSGKMVKKIIDEMQMDGEYNIKLDTYGLPVGMYYLKRSIKSSTVKCDDNKSSVVEPSLKRKKQLNEVESGLLVTQEYATNVNRTPAAKALMLIILLLKL